MARHEGVPEDGHDVYARSGSLTHFAFSHWVKLPDFYVLRILIQQRLGHPDLVSVKIRIVLSERKLVMDMWEKLEAWNGEGGLLRVDG